ncbi:MULTISPECIES: site-specific integrase [Pseudomonas]|uniref:Site-specific integrase n=1 Tax=Pseudomonas juntendi TaxID=2666183 RepID=A0ABD4YF07_9PSED|nr:MULTISPECIES: site-specific integrase [Pseudomonas]MDH0758072.1 site-specific integrase [Pseudomonas juntendi]MDH1919572.1 site-specific integrase [Pseudomonas juntendi]
MATFEQRPGGAWRVKIRRKGYPALSASFDTKAEAQRWAAEIEGDMSRARFVDMREAERTTLAEALDRYVREISASKKGAKQENTRANKWKKHPLAGKGLAALRSSDFAAYRDDELKAGKSTATVRLDLALISHLFTVAIKDWGIEGLSNPVMKLRMPKGAKERDRRPKAFELAGVIEKAGGIHAEMPAIIQLAVETAMRRSELIGLRRENVRAKHALLEDTKNGTRRLVPLSSKARALLDGLPARLDGRVFSLAPHSVSQYFHKACVAAGVVDLHFHDLRHEGTSRLFEKGLSMMEVASITGHKTMSMLKRYTHLCPDDLADKLG